VIGPTTATSTIATIAAARPTAPLKRCSRTDPLASGERCALADSRVTSRFVDIAPLVTRRGRARITRSPVLPDGRGRWLELWLTPVIGLRSDTLLETSGLRDIPHAEAGSSDPRSVAPVVAVAEATLHKRPAGELVPCPTLPSTTTALGSGRKRSSGVHGRDPLLADAIAQTVAAEVANAIVTEGRP
jgi:hypothetical protein